MNSATVVVVSTIMAAGAAFLQMLQPETWAPFFRAELAKKTSHGGAVFAMFVGVTGQAATSAGVGLLLAILVLSVVGVADEHTQAWAGVVVVALSLVFFARFLRRNGSQRETAERLLDGLSHGSSGASDPYGKLDQTPAQIVRTSVFSPRFILSPMFVAASASGAAHVGNALPVVAAYAVFSLVGLVWLVRRVGNGQTANVFFSLIDRTNLYVGLGVALLGLVTVLAG